MADVIRTALGATTKHVIIARDVGVEGLTKEFGVYSLDPPTEHGPAARAVVNALIAAGHLRPTEGSDTDG